MRVLVGVLLFLCLNAIEGASRGSLASPYNPYAFGGSDNQRSNEEKEVRRGVSQSEEEDDDKSEDKIQDSQENGAGDHQEELNELGSNKTVKVAEVKQEQIFEVEGENSVQIVEMQEESDEHENVEEVIVNRPNNLLYAKIIPIAEDMQPSDSPFVAYLKPLERSQAKYEVFCSREAQPENLEELTAKLEEINEKIQKLTNDYKRLKKSAPPQGQGMFQFTPFTNPPQVKIPKIKLPKIQSQNFNNGESNVLQCSGVTCPKGTAECKISERSDEPNHETITTKVWCFGNAKQIMKQDERTDPNPNPGSSVSRSQTVQAGNNDQMNQHMNGVFGQAQKTHKQSMANMQQQMDSIFNNPFFKNG